MILTSPLRRCQSLAEKLALRYPNAPLKIDARLSEMDFGNWQGLNWADVPRAEIDLWVEDFMQARPHGGESVAMVEARVRSLVEEVALRPGAPTVVAITHKGVIRAALAVTGGSDPWSFNPDYGEVVQL